MRDRSSGHDDCGPNGGGNLLTGPGIPSNRFYVSNWRLASILMVYILPYLRQRTAVGQYSINRFHVKAS